MKVNLKHRKIDGQLFNCPCHHIDVQRIDLNKQPHSGRCCLQCGKELARKRYSNGAPESELNIAKRLFCDQSCFGKFCRNKPQKYTIERLKSGNKMCPKCGEVLPLGNFPLRGKTRFAMPRYSYCKTCHSAYQRVNKLKNQYNLTPEEAILLTSYQSGVCAICKRPPKEAGKELAIDHDHKTGLIRGRLCWLCNRILGIGKDNPILFKAAYEYLTNPPAIIALGERRYGLPGRGGTKKQAQLLKTLKKLRLTYQEYCKTQDQEVALNAEEKDSQPS